MHKCIHIRPFMQCLFRRSERSEPSSTLLIGLCCVEWNATDGQIARFAQLEM
ncbi:hypothetical protein [Chloroflexus sp.]|uniref:hypothetical protein n=1 Tax=Chloroflexus sp. TaxID=1904827 RepID=UPI003D0F495A